MDRPISVEGDNILANRAADGDRRAFGTLAKRHGPRLLNIALRTLHNSDEAQDAVQDAMASAWFKIGQFDQSRELAPWLTRITLNKCRDHLRRRKVRRFFEFGSGQEHELETADETPDQSSNLESRQLLSLMEEKIATLPHSLREPFVLVTFDERSQAETAALLGISEKAVESRVYRARNKLRDAAKSFEG